MLRVAHLFWFETSLVFYTHQYRSSHRETAEIYIKLKLNAGKKKKKMFAGNGCPVMSVNDLLLFSPDHYWSTCCFCCKALPKLRAVGGMHNNKASYSHGNLVLLPGKKETSLAGLVEKWKVNDTKLSFRSWECCLCIKLKHGWWALQLSTWRMLIFSDMLSLYLSY